MAGHVGATGWIWNFTGRFPNAGMIGRRFHWKCEWIDKVVVVVCGEESGYTIPKCGGKDGVGGEQGQDCMIQIHHVVEVSRIMTNSE